MMWYGYQIWGRWRELWFHFASFCFFNGLKLILNVKRKCLFLLTQKYAHVYNVLKNARTSLGVGPRLCGVRTHMWDGGIVRDGWWTAAAVSFG